MEDQTVQEITPTQTIKDSHPTIKRRKTAESKMKLTQIHEKSPDPDNGNELVAYDSSRESRSIRRKRAMIDDLYGHAKANSPIIKRAEEVRANLAASCPSFWKAMVKSNVSQGFWLHLPMQFCKLHMPKIDTVFLVENETGEEYQINYISERTALSSGWKAFCDSNQLFDGDVLVFHLVEPTKFKVYIVRANGFLNAEAKPLNSAPLDVELEMTTKNQIEENMKNYKRSKWVKSSGFLQDNAHNNSLMVLETSRGQVDDQFDNDREDFASDTLKAIQLSESTYNFKEVKNIDNFVILVGGLTIDSDLSDYHRTKYYELCSSQKSFLHNHLLKSINRKLAAEIITQSVNIAEAIRACNLSTSRADYEIWDKTLKGFELLGMNVGFLRARLNRLMNLALDSEGCEESKRLKEVSLEQARTEEEIRTLELKLLTLKGTVERLDSEAESLRARAERNDLIFQEEVTAPW